MLQPGCVKAHGLGRKFKIASAGGRSLRGTVLGYDRVQTREFWALRNVELDISPGETFGIVGRNGSGKSTLLKILARIFGPSEGSCEIGGRISSLLELGAGFHQEFSAIENIYLSAAIYGIPRHEIDRELDEIIGFAELEEFAHQPVKTFSSGMFARLGFSVAMHVRPDVLLLDEVLAVGDEPFVQKCMGRIGDFRRSGGTIVLVTHDPSAVERLCTRALFLERGEPVMTGSATDVIRRYHEHLAAEDTTDTSSLGSSAAEALGSVEGSVEVLDAARSRRHRFTEGEAMTAAVTLSAPETTPPVRVTIAFRDELGRELGSRSTVLAELAADMPLSAEFRLDPIPFRNGQFRIDLQVREADSDRVLLVADDAETISVLGQAPECGGPMRIGGDWVS